MDKIQCGKCDHIVRRSFCQIKQIQVARKKLHQCELFETKVKKELEPTIYVPNVPKSEIRKFRKLLKASSEYALKHDLNVEDVRVGKDGQVYKREQYKMPSCTASNLQTEMTEFEDPKPSTPGDVDFIDLESLNEAYNDRG